MNSKSKTVLVVDDQLDMRIFLRTLLETHGYNPVLASDGLLGFESARQCQPDIILLDVMMPNEGGANMYRKLKADAQLARVPVVMLSAVAPRAFRHYLDMLNAQSDCPLPKPEAYIEKPPSPEQILNTIAGYFQTA